MATIDGVKIEVGRPLVADLRIAYKYGTGPYADAGHLLAGVSKDAPGEDTLGIYYDDPDTTPASSLRWAVAVILGEGEEPADPDLEIRLAGLGYKFFHLPQANQAVQTETPTSGPLSILAAVEKTYPAINKFLEDRKLDAYPWIEVYDEKSIIFFGPLDKHDQFYVPEAATSEKQKLPPVLGTAC